MRPGGPRLRGRPGPSSAPRQAVQALGFEAVLTFAWLPHVLGEGAAGGHGCCSGRGVGERRGVASVNWEPLHQTTGSADRLRQILRGAQGHAGQCLESGSFIHLGLDGEAQQTSYTDQCGLLPSL